MNRTCLYGWLSYGNRASPELIERQNKASVTHAERLIQLLESL